MKNWRTNLGGAISVLGTSLIGVGVLPQLLQLSPTSASVLSANQLAALWYVALAGFIMSGIGKAITALFAADASALKNVADAVDNINQKGSDPAAPPAAQKPPTDPA